MRWPPLLIVLAACHSSGIRPAAQVDRIPSAVLVEEGDTVRVGCGAYALSDPPPKELETRAELMNVDRLITDMLRQMESMTNDEARRARMDLHQRHWSMACFRYCAQQVKLHDAQRHYIGCLKWATTCRLEELLEQYDQLVADTTTIH